MKNVNGIPFIIRAIILIGLSLLIPFFVGVFAYLPNSQATDQPSNEDSRIHILIVNSYDKANTWTTQQESAFVLKLKESNVPIKVYYEYLSSKAYTKESYYEKVIALLSEKYSETPIDYIYTTDDDAAKLMFSKRDTIFKPKDLSSKSNSTPIPIVFSGLNNNYAFPKHAFGVKEVSDVSDTIHMVRQVHGASTRILAITDTTSSSEAIVATNNLISADASDAHFELFMHGNVEQIRARLSKRDYDVVIFLLFNRDDLGNDYSYLDGFLLFKPFMQTPIYSTWNFYFGHGLVGGKLIDGKQQGSSAADAILAHMRAPDIIHPIIVEQNRYTFDYHALKAHRINIANLPQNSVIINKPINYFQKHREVIIAAVLVILLLIGVIVVLIHVLKRKISALTDAQMRVSDLQRTEALYQIGVNLSHEMNSYIGNAVTLSSLGSHELNDLLIHLTSGQLTKEEATLGLKAASGVNEKIQQNLTLAVEVLEALKGDVIDERHRIMEEVNLSDLSKEVLKKYTKRLDTLGIQLSNKIAQTDRFLCDRNDVTFILMALVDNAIEHGFSDYTNKATPPTIALEAHIESGRLTLKVRDNGKGISDSKKPYVFDPFYTGSIGGLRGMGLYRVRSLAQLIYQGSAYLENIHTSTCIVVELKQRGI